MDWIRGPIIGRGATATVSLATSETSGELFAVKSTELSRSMFLQKEQSFLSNLSSPHIVKYLGCGITSENDKPIYNLCIEYVPGGTLYDEIKRSGGRLDERMIILYTQQILQGLDYLHANGLVHCDIKSENVLLGEEGAKIADLGCAKMVGNQSSADGGATAGAVAGTPAFMAPEVARGEEQGFAADIWALGCTIIEMATGKSPWPELNDPVAALYRIGFSCDVPEIPSWLSKKAREFLCHCLKRDAKERWTAKELLQHPLFDSVEPRNSPIRVLDHSFWNSVETLESPTSLINSGTCSNSPKERIQKLIGGDHTLSLVINAINWTWSEDWITVRSNDIEESKRRSDENNAVLEDHSSFATTADYEEELQSSIFDKDMFVEYTVIANIGDLDSIRIRRDFLLACHCVIDSTSVLDNFNFQRSDENSCSLIKPQLSSIVLNRCRYL